MKNITIIIGGQEVLEKNLRKNFCLKAKMSQSSLEQKVNLKRQKKNYLY